MHPIHKVISALSESDLIAILEAARIALSDEDIAADISERMDISDGHLIHLREQIYKLLN